MSITKLVIVLQVRLNSLRLYGKALMKINKIPILILAAKRLSNKGHKVIVATSNNKIDDPIISCLKKYDLDYYRGDSKNVLKRIVDALEDFKDNTTVVRATADNIFPDGNLVDEMYSYYVSKKLSYLGSNGVDSGLPYGVSLELIKLRELKVANRFVKKIADREHVTLFTKRNKDHIFKKFNYLHLENLRCTIDCSDDYQKIKKLFKKIKDPIRINWKDLCQRLLNENQSKNNNRSLILGGAQLGLRYGNLDNKIDFKNTSLIIKTAIANNIKTIDTARSYGESEKNIGQSITKLKNDKIRIISKLKSFDSSYSGLDLKKGVKKSVYTTLYSLGLKKIDTLLLHQANNIFIKNGVVWKSLLNLKKKKLIKKLGVSVQTVNELLYTIKMKDVSVIQLPFNILDNRWDKYIHKIIEAKLSHNLEIHVRSCYLQGLLLTNSKKHWEKTRYKNYKEINRWLLNKSKFFRRQSITDLCLSYIKSQNWIDGIIIGVDSRKQLLENIRLINLNKLSLAEISDINISRPKITNALLNPHKWRNKF